MITTLLGINKKKPHYCVQTESGHMVSSIRGAKLTVLFACVSELLPVPLPREFGSPSDGFVPHDGEVGGAGEVLSDGDGRVHVEDYVPPPACGHTASHH